MSTFGGGQVDGARVTPDPARTLLVPGVIAFVLIATLYLPTHASEPLGQALLAALAGVYVVAMSVVLPRATRVVILGGRRTLGDAPFLRPGLLARGASPARRLLAVGAGAVVSGALAAVALAATAGEPNLGYAHAIGSLAVLANLGLLLATVVPMPGLAGWEAVEATVDLRCPNRDHRAAHAARTAKAAAAILAGILSALAVASGDMMLLVLGILTTAMVWVQAEALRRLDVVERFLSGHTALQLARPISAVCRVDDRIADLSPVARACPCLVLDGAGLFVGALGPRQMQASLARPAARCGDAMVPARTLRIVQADTPAAEISAALQTAGIVLVRGDRQYGAVDADDVVAQLRSWTQRDAAEIRVAHEARR